MTAIIADGLRPGVRDLGARILDAVTASRGRVAAFLVAMSLVCFLPGFFNIPPIDRDEARFAQATKQMIESGDYIDIRFQDEVRYKKPVGIYWLQAAAVHAGEALGVPQARTTIWLYRMPSLVGALGAVLLTYWTALAFVSRRSACVAALMLAASILLGVEARLAKTDAMLLATVVAAMGVLAREYLGKDKPAEAGWLLPGLFWTAVAGGVLLKGPLTAVAAADHSVPDVLLSAAGLPALATAGTGDVLSGIIGAFLARGVDIHHAAALAAHAHGRAAASGRPVGLVAGDLPDLVAAYLGEWSRRG